METRLHYNVLEHVGYILVTCEFLTKLSEFQASSEILLKNIVIIHLYEQFTRSLGRIYLGLDSHKANLWV